MQLKEGTPNSISWLTDANTQSVGHTASLSVIVSFKSGMSASAPIKLNLVGKQYCAQLQVTPYEKMTTLRCLIIATGNEIWLTYIHVLSPNPTKIANHYPTTCRF